MGCKRTTDGVASVRERGDLWGILDRYVWQIERWMDVLTGTFVREFNGLVHKGHGCIGHRRLLRIHVHEYMVLNNGLW